GHAEHRLSLCETLTVMEDWQEIMIGDERARLEACLPSYLKDRRWFGGKSREIKAVQFREAIPLAFGSQKAFLALLAVDYVQGDPEEYFLPIAFATGADAELIQRDYPSAVMARVQVS